jgi:hypothetical protein
MKTVINISEIVETIDLPQGPFEVCAAVEADYDEARRKLVVQLSSFVRTTDLRKPQKQIVARWLPRTDPIEETVDQDEAVILTKDIFRRWLQKLQRTIPSANNPEFGGKNHVTEIHR